MFYLAHFGNSSTKAENKVAMFMAARFSVHWQPLSTNNCLLVPTRDILRSELSKRSSQTSAVFSAVPPQNDCSVSYENKTHHILGFALRPHINHSTPRRASHLFHSHGLVLCFTTVLMSLFSLLPCSLFREEMRSLQRCLLNNTLADVEERGKPGQAYKAAPARAQLLAVSYTENNLGVSRERITQH